MTQSEAKPTEAGRPRRSLRTLADLTAANLAPESQLGALRQVLERYAVAITPEMLSAMQEVVETDPVALQFVPRAEELNVEPGEREDPIADDAYSPVKGIVHRYPDRVLLKMLHVCPVYCRFCFRREKVGPGSEYLTESELESALRYIAETPRVWEVIFTGGDPLLLSPSRLRRVLERLERIEHVEILRFHTRVPLVDPKRVTSELVEALKSAKTTYVVQHVNHANEFTPEGRQAIARIVDAGIPMLSQSVLLGGVNDDAATLEELFRCLVRERIKPYYLHHLDLARGTHHFRVSIEEGQALMKALRGTVSGICQPTYVLDIPGGHGKVPIQAAYLEPHDSGSYLVEGYRGTKSVYPPAT